MKIKKCLRLKNSVLFKLVTTPILFWFVPFYIKAAVQINNPLAVNDLKSLLVNIAKGVGTIIASLATISFIIAAVIYLSSAGSQEIMAKAKKAFLYAVVGFVIAITAGLIAETIQQLMGG